jgi:hypothetical protein
MVIVELNRTGCSSIRRLNTAVLARLGLSILISFGAVNYAVQAQAAAKSCRALFTDSSRRANLLLSSPSIEDHYVRTSNGTFLPFMNSRALVEYTSRGGRPMQDVASFWSTKPVLQSVLSLNGPLGNKGPLSPEIGVFGADPSHPSYWVNEFMNHPWTQDWLKLMRAWSPVANPFGPLNQYGPLFVNFHEGVYNVLGTAGFLGPLVLGPDGPLGGLQTVGLKGPDENGNYHDSSGRVVDVVSVDVDFSGNKRNYRIFKYLNKDYASRISASGKGLDTSFAFDDQLRIGENSKSFDIVSPDEQLVSFLVVPFNQMTGRGRANNFNLTVSDASGVVLLESKEMDLVNFVQLKVSKGARLKVTVSRPDLSGDSTPAVANFRLMVIGDPYFDLNAEGALDDPSLLPTK